ncbi:MAG: hypothetical protein ACYC4D_01985 [Thermoleophilia bacterium]
MDVIGRKRKYLKAEEIKSRVASRALYVAGFVAIILALIPWYSSHLQNESLKQAENGFQVESLHTAESAVFYNPLSIQARFVLAGAQQRIGRAGEARATLLEATEMQPLNYLTWRQLAISERDHLNSPELAEEHFRKAISLNPMDSQLRKEAGIPAE